MEPLKARSLSTLLLVLVFTSACTGGVSEQLSPTLPPPTGETQTLPTTTMAPRITATVEAPLATASEGEQAVLLFGIGMHIEPFGAVPSSLVGEAAPKAPPKLSPGKARPIDYNMLPFFKRSVQDIRLLSQIIEKHDGVMTVQVQTPFTQAAISSQNSILADLAQSGHEMALHFHEDAHLGIDSESLLVETWCAVMEEEINLIKRASGVSAVRYWSGGNLYSDLFQAAACAGLDVNSDWKNPNNQRTPLELVGLHPWRPAGGTDGHELTLITRHDPGGAVIFLPEGQYDRSDFASMRRSQTAGGDQAYFEFLEDSLLKSLAAAEPGQVNVFHFTVHPGEFRGDPQHPFLVIERFLREVVDPLVASGKVRWATFSQMADAYKAWESANPGVDPR